ncbi:MAG: hypothetical protein R3272_15000 [Candidatus Promineifilaceae bacterium]|nr:hypothetical protein [Candidatus Promineifilaceae bacterium]
MTGQPAKRLIVLLVFGLVFLLGGCEPAEAPEVSQAPSDAGYPVLPLFADFYDTYGGVQLFGQPISGECVEVDGTTVQYFERMRLEQQTGGEQITLFPLGRWALSGLRQREPAPLPGSGRDRFFPETGYSVQDEFLAFYDAFWGETVLGPPLSEQLQEGELRVQYFLNGRLEWHPSAQRAQRVQLGPLGRAHYQQASIGLSCDSRAQPLADHRGPVSIEASVRAPILYADEKQQIFVSVTQPGGAAVSGVPVELTITYRGETFTRPLGVTNGEGRIEGPISLPHFEPGEEVDIHVSATTESGIILGTTSLSFQTWW